MDRGSPVDPRSALLRTDNENNNGISSRLFDQTETARRQLTTHAAGVGCVHSRQLSRPQGREMLRKPGFQMTQTRQTLVTLPLLGVVNAAPTLAEARDTTAESPSVAYDMSQVTDVRIRRHRPQNRKNSCCPLCVPRARFQLARISVKVEGKRLERIRGLAVAARSARATAVKSGASSPF